MLETVPSFVDALQEIPILDAEQLRQVREELLPRLGDARTLAKDLMRRGWLTAFQASYLLKERGRELVFEPYVLLERLGEGGMGKVYKARHQKLGRVVALKVIRKEEVSDAKTLERFKREIAAIAQLSHPNVVEAYDADQVGELYFYVMEFVDGVDLDRLVLQNGPLAVHKACDYIRQAALGLQHAHEQGLVHRDIKPGNFLVTADGSTVKLLDLGLARMRGTGPDGQTQTVVTQIGTFIGTPDFVAPEQAVNSRDVDIRADIYSLGCTFYYLLTGQPPFPGTSVMDKLIKHKTEEPIRVEATRADVPRAVAAILRKLMAKQPGDRYQTPAEVAAALEPFCTEEACLRAPVSVRRPRARSRKLKRPVLPSTVIVPSAEIVDASAVEIPRPSLKKVSSAKAFALLNRPRSRRDWYRWGLAGVFTLVLFAIMLLVLANLVGSRSAAMPPEKQPPAKVVKPSGEAKKPGVRR